MCPECVLLKLIPWCPSSIPFSGNQNNNMETLVHLAFTHMFSYSIYGTWVSRCTIFSPFFQTESNTLFSIMRVEISLNLMYLVFVHFLKRTCHVDGSTWTTALNLFDAWFLEFWWSLCAIIIKIIQFFVSALNLGGNYCTPVVQDYLL